MCKEKNRCVISSQKSKRRLYIELASPSVYLTREENVSILSMSVNEKWLVVMAGKNNRGNEFFLIFSSYAVLIRKCFACWLWLVLYIGPKHFPGYCTTVHPWKDLTFSLSALIKPTHVVSYQANFQQNMAARVLCVTNELHGHRRVHRRGQICPIPVRCCGPSHPHRRSMPTHMFTVDVPLSNPRVVKPQVPWHLVWSFLQWRRASIVKHISLED